SSTDLNGGSRRYLDHSIAIRNDCFLSIFRGLGKSRVFQKSLAGKKHSIPHNHNSYLILYLLHYPSYLLYLNLTPISMIKAIFFDIDGTLLSFKTHQVPDSTRQAFQLLKEKDIKVFVSTGRSFNQLEHIRYLDFDGFITFIA